MGGLGRDRRGQRGDRTPTPRPRHPPGRFARRPERPACAVGIFQAPLTMRTPPPLALVLLALACVAEHGPLTIRMAHATTSYLTRAARQPVSWQPWGREAFALAARLNRPVLLYVGADDCRWCVVMDREVYGDPTIGAVIDSLFVPVRVDRDERPDVAQRYEAAVQWLAGLRGYPLTLFLTPDGSAFLGGTYFPADDPVTGRGMKQMLPEVARSYREQRRAIDQHAALVRQLELSRGAAARGALRPDVIAAAIDTVRDALAVAARGAGVVGSFVHTQAAALLLAAYARTDDASYLAVARRALDLLVDSAACRAATRAAGGCGIRCKWRALASRPTTRPGSGATSRWRRISPPCWSGTTRTRRAATAISPSAIPRRRPWPTARARRWTISCPAPTRGRHACSWGSPRRRATPSTDGARKRHSGRSRPWRPRRACARRPIWALPSNSSPRASAAVPFGNARPWRAACYPS